MLNKNHLDVITLPKRLTNFFEMTESYIITLTNKEKEVGKYTVDPALFCQSSMKFKREFMTNPKSYKFESNYNPDIFAVYVNSCQQKRFTVTENTAYPLLKIAKDWETPELVKTVSEFIEKNCVHQPYILIHRSKGYHDMVYPIDAPLFAKASDKFREIYAEHPEQYTVEDETTPSVFLSLVLACQKRACHTSADEVYELLDLATEWGAPFLQKYCQRKIEEFRLQDVPDQDAIQVLLDQIKNKEDFSETVEHIIDYINYYIQQENFTDIPTQLIYYILTKAEQKGVDQDLLIPTVFKKLEKSPAAGVPLILRLNFDKLSEDEYLEIFGNEQIHQQNLNFYTGMSLSSIYENTRNYLDGFNARFVGETNRVLRDIDQDYYNIFLKSKKARETDFRKVRDTLNRQQAQIDDLNRTLNTQRDCLTEAAIRAKDAPSNEQLQRRAQYSINKSIKKCGKAITDYIDVSDAKAHDILNDLLEKYQKKLDDAVSKLGDMPEDKKEAMRHHKESLQAIGDRNKKISADLDDVKAVMAAKIVHDKLKGDQYMRRTENKLQILTEPGILGVKKEDLERSEQEIAKLEQQLQEIYPIPQGLHAF